VEAAGKTYLTFQSIAPISDVVGGVERANVHALRVRPL
jgi:hypothetical protein